MADNYLEKRMEDYRTGKLAPKSRKSAHVVSHARRPGDFTLSYPEIRVVIFGGSVGQAGLLAGLFRQVGAKVAFCHSDSKSCVPLAQATGSRYYPFDPSDGAKRGQVVDDIAGRWGGVDVAIDLCGMAAVCDGSGAEGDTDAFRNVATLILIHSHPDFSCVRLTEIENS